MDTETLATALRLAECLSNQTTQHTPESRRYVVVRGDRSGVFSGVLTNRDGTEVTLTECRHLWYWNGASGTDELAQRGVSKPDDCKFTAPSELPVLILDAVTVLDCTPEAEASLRAVSIWSQFK